MNRPLRIAIVHYHLRGGGVTRIVEHVARGVRSADVRLCVLVGEPPPAGSPLTPVARVVDGLGYTMPGGAAHPAGPLAQAMLHAAEAALGGKPDVWHIHNHALGKNRSLPGVVHALAANSAVLLQIHDFAEDGRPGRYRELRRLAGQSGAADMGTLLYPIAPQIHYAVLNRRDREILQHAGIAPSQVHLLQNPVVAEDSAAPPFPAPSGGSRLLLYPTRAIRRKNLGEFLLWSAAASGGDRFGVTLAPQNPEEQTCYLAWVTLARELDLPVAFELGARAGVSYEALIASAEALVTTSLAEGFGLAFLEPWLAGRPVLGRNLPEITRDFVEAGVDLTGLYDRLMVPLALVGYDALRQAYAAAIATMLRAYAQPPAAEALDRALAAAVTGDAVDFGKLDARMQARVIRAVCSDATLARTFAPPTLRPKVDAMTDPAANRRRIATAFSLPAYTQRLTALYERVAAAPRAAIVKGAAADRLLAAFLAPERLCLLLNT
jgi:glycosyltransferase involved in cell wall biosynthesis